MGMENSCTFSQSIGEAKFEWHIEARGLADAGEVVD